MAAANEVVAGLKKALKGVTSEAATKKRKAVAAKAAKAEAKKPNPAQAPAADPSLPKPMGQNPGGDYKPSLAEKAGRAGNEALRLLEGMPMGGPAVRGGRALLALTKAKAGTEVARRTNVAVKAEKAGELATRSNVAKRAADAPKSAPGKKFDTSAAEDAKYTADRPKLPAPAAKTASRGKAAAGAAAAVAAGVAAGVASTSGGSKTPEKVVSGKANASTQAAKTEAKSAPKSSDKPVGKKGDYPVYKKDSATAADFRKAFASARNEGKAVFTWQGRKYNTKLKSK